MELRQRRPAASADDDAYQRAEEEKARRAKAFEQEQQMAPYLVGFVVFIVVAIVGLLLWTHPHVEFHKPPAGKKDHPRDEVLQLLQSHTMLHIAGLHRSGTTLLAETLSKHPGIAGLKHQPGADARKAAWINKVMGEGIFLQTVYPKFGLDHNKFLLRKWAGQLAKKIPFLPEDALPFMRLREGVGRFALHPNHHLDDSSSLIVPEAQEHLFNEWALFWNLSRPVLLEKSPSNIVISPFLHRLWGLGLSASPARFIFVRRHPIPVALATQRRAGAIVSDLDVGDLVEHWVAAEERRSKDIESYFDFYEKDRDVYRVLDFEDMLQEPRKVLAELFRWLKLQESEELLSTFEKEVRPDQNTQYFKVYCNRLVHGGPAVVEAHHRMVVRWRSKVLAVSRYDLFNIPKICRELLLGPTEDAVNSSEKQLIQKTMSEEETFDAELASKKEI
eukprot:TRINITY_DN16026_c0_g1_i1.p1 TRINITY_DN16026_c0_g1~~TRINITY_DN16026_c0_g1_i1.p1  ORF type:complete len:465 (+),score=86.42 TRINITY_DN16026_c0_g1_i1:59-1396(+)